MPFSGIVFDFDHTLASFQAKDLIFSPQAASVFVHMMTTCDRFRGFRTLDLSHKISASIGHNKFEQFMAYSCLLYQPQHILPTAKQLVQACDKYQIPRAVLSDHPCLEKLQAIGMEKGWSCVVHSQTYGALKPLPDALYAVSAQLGIPTSELIVIGDRHDSDGLMAQAAGSEFVHIDQATHLLQRIRNKV